MHTVPCGSQRDCAIEVKAANGEAPGATYTFQTQRTSTAKRPEADRCQVDGLSIGAKLRAKAQSHKG
jgi:hypothetical protein